MKTLKATLPPGKLGMRLDEMASYIGIKRPRLYLVCCDKTGHILKTEQAMLLEIYTNGLVPAESTNPHIPDVQTIMNWLKHRGEV